MLPINETAVALGITRRQTYRLVTSLRPILAPHIRRGGKGKLLLDSSALEILKRAKALRREGATTTDAMTIIREEINGNGGGEQGRPTGNEELVSRLLEEKDARIHALESEVSFLRLRVEELTPLALPRPRRWFGWIRGRRIGPASA